MKKQLKKLAQQSAIYKAGFFILLAFVSAFTIKAQDSSLQALGKKGKLIWKDEFKGSGLPNPKKWSYEEGFVRNKESQYYTRARIENCSVQNGKLVITSRKEKFENAAYTSASINTENSKAFSGDIRVEVRAKLPKGKGIWPAIWMMGINRKEVGWPRCSEIDIMEHVGHTPTTVWGTLHWWDSTASNERKNLSKGGKLFFDDLSAAYHVYGMERKGDRIQFFVDDQYYFTMAAPPTAYPGSFLAPQYLLINTAVGGGWGGEIDDRIFPQQFFVDYVRVYKLK